MKSLRLSTANPDKAWALVDIGNPFLETQCLAIAEAMDFPAHLYRVSLPWLWRALPLGLVPNIMGKVHSTPKSLMSSRPSFVICGGKVALKIGSFLRKRQGTFVVALGPTSSAFHKVIVENHIREEKSNIIKTLGPLHRIGPQVLLQARQTYYRKIDHLPKPRVGLFLEGNEPLGPLVEIFVFLNKKTPFSLMIHGKGLSEENRKDLASAFERIPHLLWQGQGEDPYLGFLSHSDALIVSHSSSLRVAEATSVAKPLLIHPVCETDSFVQALIQKGYASFLTKDSSLFSFPVLPPLQETKRVAQMLKEAYLEASS
jgi:uncharacterized protein